MHCLLHIISKVAYTEAEPEEPVYSENPRVRKAPGMAATPEEKASTGSNKGSHTHTLT